LKKRILLADRSSSIARVVASALAGEDVEVTAVTDGYAAERYLSESQPDLVLADVFLLGKDGYELCRSIRQDARLAGLPVVLLVGSFEPFDAAAAARLGADGKLTKPIEPAGLIDMTRKFLGDRDRSLDIGDSGFDSDPVRTATEEPPSDTELQATPTTAVVQPATVQPATDTSVS
jgi:CheY-like chemotaxis protein